MRASMTRLCWPSNARDRPWCDWRWTLKSSSNVGRRVAVMLLASAWGCHAPPDDLVGVKVPVCRLSVTPRALDFGTVRAGTSVAMTVMLSDLGDASCDIA